MAERLGATDRVVLLLSLVRYLLDHGDTSLDELAAVFEVDAALMRELVEFLGVAGVPGETSTYQDEDLFDIDWAALEDEGIVRLTRVIAVDDAPRFTALERAALLAGLHTLIPMLSAAEREQATSAARKLGWGADHGVETEAISATLDAEDPSLRLVSGALERRDRLAFDYRDLRGAVSHRKVEPLALVEAASGWYLRAFCLDREQSRTFSLAGMRRVRVVGARGADDAIGGGSSAKRTLDGRDGRRHRSAIGPSDATIPANIRVRERALHRIAEFSPRVLSNSSDHSNGAASSDAGDGWLKVAVKLAYPAAAVRLVQCAPGDVVVDTPRSAREAVLAWAERALAQYDA